LDADSKLVACWHVGRRDPAGARRFIDALAARLVHRVQLTTDGLSAYLAAVDGAFGADVDYAMLVKLYGPDMTSATRYSPAKCVGAETVSIQGRPRFEHISTSYVERQNLTM